MVLYRDHLVELPKPLQQALINPLSELKPQHSQQEGETLRLSARNTKENIRSIFHNPNLVKLWGMG